MLPYIPLGPFLLQTPGLALLIGLWIGASLAEKEAKRLKINAAVVYNLVFFGLIAGIVGARLAYAVRYLSAYLDNPLGLFSLNPNTLAPSDGIIIGLVVAVLYSWRKKLPLRPTLDALALGLSAFLVLLGVAHFLSGDAFGAPAEIPWSIYLWDESRHPSQIYEVLAALGVFFVVRKRPLGELGVGMNFLLTVALSAGARLVLEAFRGDSLILGGGFRSAQVISLLVLLGCLWLLRIWAQNNEQRV